MKLLMALDGSTGSSAVVREVASRLWPKDSECCVLTAIDPFFFTKAPLLLAAAKADTQRTLDEYAENLKATGMRVSSEILLENPRRGIPKAASEWKAELIVMGSHGNGAFVRLLMGSTAQAVLRHAGCSVEIVREGRRKSGGMKVLVPTDGSECAEEALRDVAAQPWPDGTEVRVICVPEVPVLDGVYPYYPPELVLEAAAANDAHAREAIQRGACILKKAGLSVMQEVLEPRESPVRAILGMADVWGADLIVMGSHGRRGFDRYVMGSVSESVALHAHCSVEVVRGASKQ
jgi:nucleotide-binding universal stress UspA family protein